MVKKEEGKKRDKESTNKNEKLKKIKENTKHEVCEKY